MCASGSEILEPGMWILVLLGCEGQANSQLSGHPAPFFSLVPGNHLSLIAAQVWTNGLHYPRGVSHLYRMCESLGPGWTDSNCNVDCSEICS